jgi:hypothetical protein
MPMVITMSADELDTELTRLFAQAYEPIDGGAFVAAIVAKIERTRRARLARRVLAGVVVLLVACFNLRLVLEKTAALIRVVGELSSTYAVPLVTPWGWTLSMLLAAWVVFRTRPSRR